MRKDRLESLDSWRAIAIVAVMLFHYLVRRAPPLNPTDAYGYSNRYSPWLELGRYGVQVFFVISGAVITMTLLRSRSPIDFAVRRFARLYPAYLICMTFTFLFVAAFGPDFLKVSPLDYVANLTMLANRVGAEFVDGSYWSLVVEIEFYVYVAIAWSLLKDRFWVALIALGLLGAPAERINAHAADAVLLARYMPYFLAGMGAWFFFKEQRRAAGAWLGVTAVGLFFFHARTLTLGGQPRLLATLAVGIACVGLIASLAFELGNSALAWLGQRSYSLYLIHQNVGVSLIVHAKPWAPDWLAFSGAAGISLLLAWASYNFVEEPGAQLIRRLWTKRTLQNRAATAAT